MKQSCLHSEADLQFADFEVTGTVETFIDPSLYNDGIDAFSTVAEGAELKSITAEELVAVVKEFHEKFPPSPAQMLIRDMESVYRGIYDRPLSEPAYLQPEEQPFVWAAREIGKYWACRRSELLLRELRIAFCDVGSSGKCEACARGNGSVPHTCGEQLENDH